MNQTHNSSGDNTINKIVNNFYGKSQEHHALKERIIELQEDLGNITNKQSQRALHKSEKLNNTIQELKDFEASVLALATTIAQITIDTERLQLAVTHFEAGNLREANAVLQAEIMLTEQTALLEAKDRKTTELKQLEKQLEQNATEFLLKAQITAADFTFTDRFELACKYLKQSLTANRNIENLFAYGCFLQEHNQDDIALPIYEEILSDYRNPEILDNEFYLWNLATTLNNVALLHKKTEIELAEQEFLESLDIRRNLAKVNSRYNIEITKVLINLASLHSKMNDKIVLAKEEFAEAIKICRDEIVLNNSKALAHLSGALHNSAFLNERIDPTTAEVEYKEALLIRRHLATTDTLTYLPKVAKTLSNLALIHAIQDKDHILAENEFKEAYTIQTRFCQINPLAYLPDLAMTTSNMSLFYQISTMPDKTKSLRLAKETIIALNGLIYKQPDHKIFFDKVLLVVKDWGLDEQAFLQEVLVEIQTDSLQQASSISLKTPDLKVRSN